MKGSALSNAQHFISRSSLCKGRVAPQSGPGRVAGQAVEPAAPRVGAEACEAAGLF